MYRLLWISGRKIELDNCPTGDTVNVMEKRFRVADSYGEHLWTRDTGRHARQDLEKQLEALEPGNTLVIDLAGVQVFDYSFASEFFGKVLLALPREFPDRFLIVENLTDYTHENLVQALEGLGLAMVERKKGKLNLIGKVHSADVETFRAIEHSKIPVTSNHLKERLEINLTAVNERLAKLAGMGLIRRSRITSPAGREQYQYSIPP